MTDTLFYDGKCPLCSKEIRLLSKLKDNDLLLQDIHAPEVEQQGDLPSRSSMLKILHLRTSSGRWLQGLDANVAAWNHTAFGWLLAPLRWPGLSALADRAYHWWAERRYCKLSY